MNTHELLIQNVLPFSKNLFSLSSSRLLSFSLSSDVLSKSDHTSDSSLLLQSDKLLGKIVHGSRDDIRLQSLRDTIKYSLLIGLDQGSLFFQIGSGFPLFSGSQLRDQVESLLLSLEHHVLLGSASEQSLQENDSSALLVVRLQNIVVVLSLLSEVIEDRGVGSHFDVVQQVFTFVFSIFAVSSSFDLNVDGGLSLLKLSNVTDITSGEGLLELLIDSVDHNLALEVLAWE